MFELKSVYWKERKGLGYGYEKGENGNLGEKGEGMMIGEMNGGSEKEKMNVWIVKML